MPTINKHAIVPYTAEQMYRLVADVRAYPEFLPWCQGSEIISEDEDEVRASLTLAWSGLQKSFTTCNRLQPHKMIEVRLVEGPFSHLEGFWRFEALGEEGCKVMLDMEFEFSNKLFSMMLGPIFTQVTHSLVDAFCQRAEKKYGTEI